MYRWLLRIFFCSFLGVLPLATLRILHDKGGNFRVSKIVPLTKQGSFFSGELPEKLPRFRYLAMGHHVYAFVSEDQKWVLKFIRYHKFKPHFWKKVFPQREKDFQQRKERLSFLLQSHILASQNLKEETGLIYYQEPLAKAPFLVTLVDGWGREKKIDVNPYGFVLQRYFPLYGKELPRLLENKKNQAIENLFSSYFEIIGARFAKGLVNKDRRGWGKNYGIDERGVAYEIDLGGYLQQASDKDWEIKQCSRDFREWLEKKAPELLPMFEKELEKALQKPITGHQESRKQKLKKLGYEKKRLALE